MTTISPSPAWNSQKEAELVAAIVNAVPELHFVHEGCYLIGDGYHNAKVLMIHLNSVFMFSATVYKFGSGVLENIDFDKRAMKISPRDLTLEDVLRALRTVATAKAPYFDIAAPLLGAWDMGKPLSDQSELTKQFLHSILCPLSDV